jgi:hypothetical protein
MLKGTACGLGFLVVLTGLTLAFSARGTVSAETSVCVEAEATCKGSDPCNACKNCKACKFCSKDGGTCGVCQTGAPEKE